MHTHNYSSPPARAQWVVPPTARSKEHSSNATSKRQHTTRQYHTSESSDVYSPITSNDSGISEGFDASSSQQTSSSSNPPKTALFIDVSLCKTISLFVNEYLRELNGRQRLINQARAKLVSGSNLHNLNDIYQPGEAFIARNDTSKLRVRDEQTRAIETIKQLTNYLRELSHLKRQCENSSDPIDLEAFNMLSDVRTDIIQALNDFVLTNGDIDVPIIDSDDVNREYDLCIDAHVLSKYPTGQVTPLPVESVNGELSPSIQLVRSETPLIVLSDNLEDGAYGRQQCETPITISEQNPLGDLERRQCDILKLERDSMELRRLFADFYTLVKEQGEQVSTIEDNIVITAQHINAGQQHLSKTMRGLTILVPVTGCMAGALVGGPLGFVVGGKLTSISIVCAASLLGLISSLGAQRCITSKKMKDS